MREHAIQLEKVMFSLIRDLVHKSQALAKIGVGPDAKSSAASAKYEIIDLIRLSKTLLNVLAAQSIDGQQFQSVFDQVKFYIHQENLRITAVHAVDGNKIHEHAMSRIIHYQSQLDEIHALAFSENSNNCSEPEPKNDIQKQYKLMSAQYIVRVTQAALDLLENPNLSRRDAFSETAWRIMQKHALPNGRYHNTQRKTLFIENLNHCQKICSEMKITPLRETLDAEKANVFARKVHEEMQTLQQRFNKIVKPNRPKKAESHGLSKCMYLGIFATACVVGVGVSWLIKKQEQESGSIFNL